MQKKGNALEKLLKKGINEPVIKRSYDFTHCTLCPRACKANREEGRGICGVGKELKIARAALNFWEEPCISGKEGSGTVFFSGCPLHCVFCQNREISGGEKGKEISKERFVKICFELKAAGANNINLVTPMHYAPQIREALLPIKKDLGLPIVVNTGGYDTEEQIASFEGLADIWLPDFKFTAATGEKYAHAENYEEVAEKALKLMSKQVGKPVFDERGMLKSGMIVRHLILPGERKESIKALETLGRMFDKDEILLSVMSQYSPMPGSTGNLTRRITTFEQQTVTAVAERLGFEGYFQERSSASEEYIPPFDLTGVAGETSEK